MNADLKQKYGDINVLDLKEKYGDINIPDLQMENLTNHVNLSMVYSVNGENTQNIVRIKGDTMSSMVLFFTPEYAVIGTDSRCVTKDLKLITDSKRKIFQYGDALIGVVGRTNFYWHGKKMEVEDILKEPDSFYPFLKEAHLQCGKDDKVNMFIIEPRYIDYEGKNIKTLIFTSVEITIGKIEAVSNESHNRACAGVLNCRGFKETLPFNPSDKSEMIDNVRKCIEYDAKRNEAVGGDIVIYEICVDGTINKV